MAKKAEIDKS